MNDDFKAKLDKFVGVVCREEQTAANGLTLGVKRLATLREVYDAAEKEVLDYVASLRAELERERQLQLVEQRLHADEMAGLRAELERVKATHSANMLPESNTPGVASLLAHIHDLESGEWFVRLSSANAELRAQVASLTQERDALREQLRGITGFPS